MNPEAVPLAGIALAIASAAALTVGNLLQSRGVGEMEKRVASDGGSHVGHLVRNHSWLLGALLLALAIVLQLASLTFAPLIVVQPIGVSALVFTVLITAVITRARPSPATIRAIVVCVVGVAAFVTIAALVSTQHPVSSLQLGAILLVLGVVLGITGIILFVGRSRPTPPVTWVLLGGVYSAFVATLGKTIILRVQTAMKTHAFAWDTTNLLTIGCIVAIGVAGGLSIYFVQRAHASNRPDVVVAGLTVVDPAVAVVLGITILQEASEASVWAFAGFALAGSLAVAGVFFLARAETPKPVP